MSAPSKNVRFYDDNALHIKAINEMCSSIEAIHVPHVTLASAVYYHQTVPDNKYADLIASEEGGGGEPDDAVKGIAPFLPELIEWAAPGKTVLFDWDRTLSSVEGYLTPDGSSLLAMGIPTEDVSIYLCGGVERFERLHSALGVIVEKGAHIQIITNNRACSSNKDEFFQIVKVLIPTVQIDDIYCVRSGLYKNKGIFLRENSIFCEA